MPDLDASGLEGLKARLDVLIFLLLDKDRPSVTDKITKLDELGLKAKDIASITGKGQNYVTAILSQKRKKKS